VLSLFGVTQCYTYCEIKSDIINCNFAWRISNKSLSNPEPTSYLSRYLANATILRAELRESGFVNMLRNFGHIKSRKFLDQPIISVGRKHMYEYHAVSTL
jgi:hypothetical protein